MNKRLVSSLLAAGALAAFLSPAAIAADLTDIGYLDQAQLGSLPVFASANVQLSAYQQQMRGQFEAAMRAAKSDADRQRISLQFQQEYSDKQRELVGPLFQRTQLAIADVADRKKLSVVVDKRIVVYGGTDITKDVIAAFAGSQAIQPPSATPAPSEIGFVDQSALDQSSKVKDASDQMQKFQEDQKKIFSQKLQSARTDIDKNQVAADYQKTLQDKQDALLKPLVDQTKNATTNVAKQKGLLLVVDRADIIYGGTDITKDVQDALGK